MADEEHLEALTITIQVRIPAGLREKTKYLHTVEYVMMAIQDGGKTFPPPDPFHRGLEIVSCKARGVAYGQRPDGTAIPVDADGREIYEFVPEGAVERKEPWGD